MAAGAVQVLRAAGRRIPDDVAIVGFDDSPIAETADPPLTSVRQPIEEMGAEMVRLLLDARRAPGRRATDGDPRDGARASRDRARGCRTG